LCGVEEVAGVVLAPDQAHSVNYLPQPEDMKKPRSSSYRYLEKCMDIFTMSASEQNVDEDGSTVAEPNLTYSPQRLVWYPAQQLFVVIQAFVYTVQR